MFIHAAEKSDLKMMSFILDNVVLSDTFLESALVVAGNLNRQDLQEFIENVSNLTGTYFYNQKRPPRHRSLTNFI